MAGYRGGHILRIKVKNFMTYDDLELFPKPGLNLILGLNGSGKSTIMCAICLGLAGKPQYTGRSAQLSDFVKYGCDKAIIEIELEQVSKRNIVITRIIQNDKSTWLLNKSVVSFTEVQNAVKKFNIDVSNLCQFLPQEKVIEFSKMDKKQRLDNMLQAIGEPHLFRLFKELKQLKLDSLKLEDEKKIHQNLKDVEDQKNQRLKIDVDKHEEKLRMKEHLKSLNQYKILLDYQDIKLKLDKMKADKEPLQKQVNECSGLVQKANDDVRGKTKLLQETVEIIKQKKNFLSACQDGITKKETELVELHDKVHRKKIHFQNRVEERNNQIEKMAEIATQLKALTELQKKYLIVLPNYEQSNKSVSEQLDKVKDQLSSLTSTHAFTKLEKNKLDYSIKNTKAEIEKMRNEENKKMEFLRQRFIDVYEGVIWLQQNKNMFKSTVYPPMILLLKVNHDDNRKYIENFVSQRDLVAFLCEDKEDNKLLTNILRVKKNLKVNIVMVPENPIETYTSPNLTTELKSLGIQCFFKDILETPDAIMRFLCQCYGLHNIPLCVSSAERNMNIILQRFRTLFTPDAKITGKYSKYGEKNFSIRRDPIMNRNFLPSSNDHSERLQTLIANCQAMENEKNTFVSKLSSLEDQIKEFEKSENGLRLQKRDLLEQIKDIKNTERQIEQKTQSYDKKKFELVDEEREQFLVKTFVQGVNLQKQQICQDMLRVLKDFILSKKQKLKYNLKARFISRQLEEAKRIFSEKSNILKDLESQLEDLAKAQKEEKNHGLRLLAEIRQFSDEEKRQKMYSHFNNQTLEQTEIEIRQFQAKLDLNCEENEAVLAEYNETRKRIAETQKDIENYDKNLKQLQAEMTKKRDEWLPALQSHIRNINSKFSQYYKQLKCAGEISLDTCNNTDDFPKYGLQITLKYRDNEPFMELSNTHHSGGECSVAAIIFILSLQELTEVPFRCIDEINQGMDSQNERNIYSLIADSAKSGSCSQYFLLTPKLLMDLEMIEHRDVAVHEIYNSCFLEMKMDVEKHIELAGRN